MLGATTTTAVVEGEVKALPTAVEQEYWSQALAAFDAKDYEIAAMQFRKLGARSRPLYNVAICYLLLHDDDSAVSSLCHAR
jgi:hypothetical protein